MLNEFFGRAGKTPDQVTSADAFGWSYGTGLSRKEPGSVTIGARLACLSSYFKFLIRMRVIASNPCDALERPRVSPGVPRGLTFLFRQPPSSSGLTPGHRQPPAATIGGCSDIMSFSAISRRIMLPSECKRATAGKSRRSRPRCGTH
jgi:hypothetical protein